MALAKALESGRCQLETLILWGESMRVLHVLLTLGISFVRLPCVLTGHKGLMTGEWQD